jgi:hypothetical protein
VFASAAARDAAITSPQEGQFAYLKDTNVTTYYTGSAWTNLDTTGMTNPMTTTGDMVYSSSGSTPARLGIGSTGQVMTVAGGIPSWATASSGALTKIQTSTFSAVADTSTTFDGVFTSTYLGYVIVFKNMFSSGSQQLLMQVRVSGTTRTSGYYGAYNVVPHNGSITTTSVSNASAGSILNLQNSTGPAGLTLNARGVGNASTEPQFYGIGYDVVSLGPLWCGFERTTGEVVTGFILSVASGTVSGTVTIYGVQN